MKNIFLVFLLIVCSITANAQMQRWEIILQSHSSFRTLSSSSQDTSVAIILNGRQEEEAVRTFNYGLRYRLLNKSNVSLRVGLDINTFGYKAERIKGIRWPSEITSNGYVPDPSLPKEVQTSYKFILASVPIVLEYSFPLGKFTPFISGSIRPQTMLAAKFTTDYTIRIERDIKFSGLFDILSIGYDIGGGIYYTINPQMAASIGFNYARIFNTLQSGTIDEILYSSGVNVGFHFNL